MADLQSLPIPSRSAEIQEPEIASSDQRILLVCIINYKRVNITFEFLHNLFTTFGEVKKILFFEKTLTWKAFVEMGNNTQATKAMESLNNVNMFGDGSKMNIYLSNLKELILPKNLMNGRDYSKNQEPVANFLNFNPEAGDQQLSNVFKSFSLQDVKLSEDAQSITSFFKRGSSSSIVEKIETKASLGSIPEKEEEVSKYCHQRGNSIEKLLAVKNPNPMMLNLTEPPGLSKSISFQKQQNCIKSAELSKRGSASTTMTQGSTSSPTIGIPLLIPLKSCPNIAANCLNSAMSPINNNTTPLNLSDPNRVNSTPNSASNFNVFAGEASRVLFVKGLDDSKVKVQILYNLFSNFGNITKIIFMRAKGGALIEFQSIEYATIAKDFLNNLNFFSSYLRISYSNYQEIVLKNINFGALKEDILICDESFMRFKKNKNILINPPSNIIHLSNLTKEACQEQKIREFFEGIGAIEKIKFLIQDNQKNMCLVKFAKLEESLVAISAKHNCELEGRAVKISFTKTKI